MTNLQFISLLSTAIGSFVLVILAWLHQNTRLSELRGDFKDLRGEMIAFRNQVHADMVPLHERMARVEAKQR